MSQITENQVAGMALAARDALNLAGIARAAGLPQAVYEGLDAMEAELAEAQRIIRQQAAQLTSKATDDARLRQSRAQVTHLERRMDDTKKAAAEARKAYDAAVADHFALEAELDSPQPRLPFGADPEPEPGSTPTPDDSDAAAESEKPEGPDVAYEDGDDLSEELGDEGTAS